MKYGTTGDDGKKLNDHISDEEYLTYIKIWNEFKMKNMENYHDHYLKKDVLLLAAVFEKFIDTCLLTLRNKLLELLLIISFLIPDCNNNIFAYRSSLFIKCFKNTDLEGSIYPKSLLLEILYPDHKFLKSVA